MAEIRRVTPAEARVRVMAGKALLVCAYADEAMCRQMRLENGLTLQEFEQKLPALDKEQEIIFYCA